MGEFNVSAILRTVYGVRGLPFPQKPEKETASPIGKEFTAELKATPERTSQGSPLWGQNALGRPVFMPATLNDKELPNPLISITGEKEIVETNVVDKGTVFEKIFDRPFDITIIIVLINQDNVFPEMELKEILELWRLNEALTLKCALTDFFLQPDTNFILTKIDLLDMQGIENCQVVQLSGRSNIDFELEIE